MAADAVKVMENLGHIQFALVGHDRGARVGLRLALDHPGRLTKLAMLDIAPLEEGIGDANLQRVGRAKFLSFEAPRPENLIALDAIGFLNDALRSGTKSKTLDIFGEAALAAYAQAFNDPTRIHAFCEDFRAGDGADKEQLLGRQGERAKRSSSRRWFSGAPRIFRKRRRCWKSGATGRTMCAERRSTAAIISPRKRRKRC